MGWVHDLGQAAVITTLGMAVTFGFLTVLILAIQLSSKIILKYRAEAELKKILLSSLFRLPKMAL